MIQLWYTRTHSGTCENFLLTNARTANEALRQVLQRLPVYAKVRPEFNHDTNAGVIVRRTSLVIEMAPSTVAYF